MTLYSRWHDSGHEPSCEPNPDFPHGVLVDFSVGLPSCETLLPYPALRCGYFLVACTECTARVMVTTAGREDDPRAIRVACLKNTPDRCGRGSRRTQ